MASYVACMWFSCAPVLCGRAIKKACSRQHGHGAVVGSDFRAAYLCRADCQLLTTVRVRAAGAPPTGSTIRNCLPSLEG